MTNNVAVLGLGSMGVRMAHRLLDAGHRVRVFNRSPAAAAPLAEVGAEVATTPADAVEGCDFAISCVRDDVASRQVWLPPRGGALGALGRDAVAIESSTLSRAWVAELGEAMSNEGHSFVDAPVVGSRPQAEAGELIYLVGGEPRVVDRVRSVLLAMGRALHHTGPVGTGTAMKLAVNALFSIQVAALGEVLGLLRRSGVDDARAVEVLSTMPVTSPALQGAAALMARRTFEPLFPIELVEKDLGYVVDAGTANASRTPTSSAVRELYAEAIQRGLGDDNIHGVVKLFD